MVFIQTLTHWSCIFCRYFTFFFIISSIYLYVVLLSFLVQYKHTYIRSIKQKYMMMRRLLTIHVVESLYYWLAFYRYRYSATFWFFFIFIICYFIVRLFYYCAMKEHRWQFGYRIRVYILWVPVCLCMQVWSDVFMCLDYSFLSFGPQLYITVWLHWINKIKEC